MSELQSDLEPMRADSTYIRRRVDAMPTKKQLLVMMILCFAIAAMSRYFAH